MKKWTICIPFFLAGSLLAQFTDNFNSGTSESWTVKTPARWTVGLEHGRHVFFINTGEYSNETPEKLGEYALVKDGTWSDFSFSCLVRSREDFSTNPSADFAVVFGYQNNSNYYYMLFNHYSGYTQLFKIIADARTEIATADNFRFRNNEYHIVEIQRSGGMIAVQYDGDLVLIAYDATFGAGKIGIGSYNDAASFDDVKIEDKPLYYDRAIRKTPIVSPFALGEPAGKKTTPVIDVTTDGSFALAWQQVTGKEFWSTWQEVYTINSRVFSLEGTPLTAPIQVNSGFYAISPAIAATDDRFVLSWTDFPFGFPFLDNTRYISAKQFTLDGSVLSSTTLCMSYGASLWDIITDRSTSDIVYLDASRFSAVWNQQVFMGSAGEVYGSDVQENGGRIDSGDNPHIAADGEGRFLVVWDGSVNAQSFSKEGTPLSGKLQLDTSSTAGGNAVAANASGNAVISWTLDGGIYARRATTSGSLVGDEIQVSSSGGSSDVSINRRGNACVAWETASGGQSEILGRIIDAGGVLRGVPFVLNEGHSNFHDPKVVFYENCLYLTYEDREDSTIVVSVHLLDNWPPNFSPSFTGIESDTAIEDVPYEYTPQATDPNGDDVNFSFVDFPAWLSPSGNSIAGTPLQGDGDTSFVVVASDGVSSDSFEVHLTVIPVNDPPQITSPDSVTAYTDSIFTYTPIIVDEEDSALTWNFFDYPSWLELPETFVPGNPPFISGIVPRDAQDTTFTVIASDGELGDTLCVHIHILSANTPPRITSPDSVTAYIDSLFTYTATAVDDEDSVLTFTYLDYPSWLELPETFVPGNPPFISGIVPRDAQDTTFTMIASDGELENTLCVHIYIESINVPPQIVNLSDFEFTNTANYAIPLDLCVVDDDSAKLMNWNVLPKNDSLSVTLQENRVALFSAPNWSGTTPVLFRVTDPDGASDSLTVVATVRGDTSSVPHDGKNLPQKYALYPVYPNPFNPVTLISFGLPVASECRLAVYNLKGELIAELFRGRKEAGNYSMMWNAGDCPSGTYLIRLRADRFVQTQKCTLVK